jgi:hypothetical protein
MNIKRYGTEYDVMLELLEGDYYRVEDVDKQIERLRKLLKEERDNSYSLGCTITKLEQQLAELQSFYTQIVNENERFCRTMQSMAEDGDVMRMQLKTLAEVVLAANTYKGIIYNAGGAGAAIMLEDACELARSIISGDVTMEGKQ